MELLIYLLKASAITAVGYLLYYTVFSKFTFFSANRYYLVGVVLTAVVMPLVKIKIHQPAVTIPLQSSAIAGYKTFTEAMQQSASSQAIGLDWWFCLQLFYSIVCLALIGKLVYQVATTLVYCKRDSVSYSGYTIVNNSKLSNSSFFNFIFLNSTGISQHEQQQVLAHEQTHARLLHSADRLLMEMAKALLWFNPFIYLIANTLTEVHEFEVDQKLTEEYDAKTYASLILKLSVHNQDAKITNGFSARGIKGRLVMLFKPRSCGIKKWNYLLALPLVIAYGYYFSVTRVYGRPFTGKPFTVVLDAGHGGKLLGATGPGNVIEKDLTLQLAKEVAVLAAQKGMKVILTRDKDIEVDPADRLKHKGDAYISIHFNSVQGNSGTERGSELLITNNTLRSALLATSLQQKLALISDLNPSGTVKIFGTGRSSYILRQNTSPAVIVEVAYLSNKQDLNFATNPGKLHMVAQKLTDALEDYRNQGN